MLRSSILSAAASLASLTLASPVIQKRDVGVGVLADGTSWTASNSAFITLDGDIEFHYQTDGNLVVYSPGGNVQWNSNTGGHNCGDGGCYLQFQTDGNFVARDHGTIYWATNTYSGQFHPYPGHGLFFRNTAPFIEIFTEQGTTYTTDDELWWTTGYNGFSTHRPAGDPDDGQRGTGLPPGTSTTPPSCAAVTCYICFKRDLTIREHLHNALPWTPAHRKYKRCTSS